MFPEILLAGFGNTEFLLVDIQVAGYFNRSWKVTIMDSVQAEDVEAFGLVKLKSYRPLQAFFANIMESVPFRPCGRQRPRPRVQGFPNAPSSRSARFPFSSNR